MNTTKAMIASAVAAAISLAAGFAIAGPADAHDEPAYGPPSPGCVT